MSRKGGLLVKGTLILSAATLISKILGSLFWIPFQNIAGDYTVGLYKAAFRFTPFYLWLLRQGSQSLYLSLLQNVFPMGINWSASRAESRRYYLILEWTCKLFITFFRF